MWTGMIWWLLFLVITVGPALRQRRLELARRRLIAAIEAKRGSRVIVLVHREETMSLFGFPVYRYIDVHDSEAVIRAIHLTDAHVPLDIILHTPGGLVLAATQIARALRRHQGKVTAFVPHYAMSGGTMIALAADEIVMDEHAVLGPVDPQLGEYPAVSILKAVSDKPVAEVDDRTLILADVAGKAIKQVRASIEGLLQDHYAADQAQRLAQTLTEGRVDPRPPDQLRRGTDAATESAQGDAARGLRTDGPLPAAGASQHDGGIPADAPDPAGGHHRSARVWRTTAGP